MEDYKTLKQDMESQKVFPIDHRIQGEFTIHNNLYNEDSMNKVLSWIYKYDNALNIAEKELDDMGTAIIYSRFAFLSTERMRDGQYIGTGKFAYYGLVKTLQKYRTALGSAEKQIEKLKIY